MSDKVRRLADSFRSRAREFLGVLDLQIATTSGRQPGITDVLDRLKDLVQQSLELVAAEVDDADTDQDDIENQITSKLQRLGEWVRVYDAHFARQSRDISPAISFLLSEQAKSWDIPEPTVIVTVGEPHNFMCGWPLLSMGDDEGDLSPDPGNKAELPADLLPETGGHSSKPINDDFEDNLLAISVPRIEGNRVGWLPITLGHEWAHYLLQKRDDDLKVLDGIETDVETQIIAALEDGRLVSETVDERTNELGETTDTLGRDLTVKKICLQWIQEILCDAYAIAVFGPGAYAALVEFLAAQGDPGAIGERSHPPAAYRARLMRGWLNGLGRPLNAAELSLVDRFEDVPATAISVGTDRWADVLFEILDSIQDDLWQMVTSWVGKRSYEKTVRRGIVAELGRRVIRGITPTEVNRAGRLTTARPAEIINAAWHAHYDALMSHPTSFLQDPYPVGPLAMKAIDDFHFIESWTDAKGALMDQGGRNGYTSTTNPRGVLAYSELRARVNSGDRNSEIVMTPLMMNAFGDSSVDIRLGNQFIVFDRSSHGAYDSFAGGEPDPRTMQHRIGKAWGEAFYLHPNQLVLAAALEYLVMPGDLSAQVITRSSLGRLGLISATAVQVHPGYQGCLTLELVNLGEIPVAITPGERIAQLMFFPTSGSIRPLEPGEQPKYRYPVGPEFSKGRRDREWTVLDTMRRKHRERL